MKSNRRQGLDPRFQENSGQFNPVQFEETYDFLNDMRKRENKLASKELRKLKKKGKTDTADYIQLKKMVGKNKGELKKSQRNRKLIEAKRKLKGELAENNQWVSPRKSQN